MPPANVKPFAFVLMPFSREFDDIYKLGIKASAIENDVVAERVDEQKFSETILDRIYRQIDSADFIIADMTGQNPNVFYEVGYAHAKGKRCILITKDAKDIPFDLKHHTHIVYGESIAELKSNLSEHLLWVKNQLIADNEQKISIELTSVDGFLNSSDWQAVAEIDLIVDIRNHTDKKSPDIDAVYIHTGENWKFSQDGTECPSTNSNFQNYSLRHFIKPPVVRLSPDMCAEIKLKGEKRVWSKFKGDELKEDYRLFGKVSLEIATEEGSFSETLLIDVEVNEIPF